MDNWITYINEKMPDNTFQSDLFNVLANVERDTQHHTIYPPPELRYKALELNPQNVKVVIIGQDPYHTPGVANGLAFSCSESHPKTPPSLRNIFLELESDTGIQRINKDLSDWVQQGVLLLNTSLTVRESEAGSHSTLGWAPVIDTIIASLNHRDAPIVFILWGKHAQEKESLIYNPNHLVLSASHPSPFSARKGFFGCKHFSKTNAFLKTHNLDEIHW